MLRRGKLSRRIDNTFILPTTTTPMRRFRLPLEYPVELAQRSVRGLWEVQNRERERLWREMAQTRGLMQLLMKQRNGYRWSEADRLKIRAQFRQLAGLSPYMVLFLSPGGFLALPLLAWWLDRRRQKRIDGAQASSTE
jgi:hypothetical protein